MSANPHDLNALLAMIAFLCAATMVAMALDIKRSQGSGDDERSRRFIWHRYWHSGIGWTTTTGRPTRYECSCGKTWAE